MIDVLGFELSRAAQMLRASGYEVCCLEVKSRKGVAGNEARVIRQRPLSDGRIELAYSVFKTDVAYSGEDGVPCAASPSCEEDG
ncbi:MAG: hypothetical protein AAGU74_00370 [Bacillota bacterium]